MKVASQMRSSTGLIPTFWPAKTWLRLRRLCPLFADRAQEGDKQAALGRTW
jgi:hypothetical protein